MRDVWAELEGYLRRFRENLDTRPDALVVVSGHWEEDPVAINAGAAPPLLYDYGGFPDYTYSLTWPAPGAPAIADLIADLLGKAGIASRQDTRRGWDHGVFVPLKVMFPDADIPTVQLSLRTGLDPTDHLAIGRAIAPLRDKNVLILGSCQSYHNMRGLMGGPPDPEAEAFDEWLREIMVDPARRDDALRHWDMAAGARIAQPREDHLIPLMVAAGAATGERGTIDFHGRALGKPISGFRFG